MTTSISLLVAAAIAVAASPGAIAENSVVLNGVTWTAAPNWGQHEDLTIGNTHGTIAVSPNGLVHINTDAAHGTLVHDAHGDPVGR